MLFDRLTLPTTDWVELLSICCTIFPVKIKSAGEEMPIMSLQQNINRYPRQ